MMASVQRSIHQGHGGFSELFRGRQRAFTSLSALPTSPLLPTHKPMRARIEDDWFLPQARPASHILSSQKEFA